MPKPNNEYTFGLYNTIIATDVPNLEGVSSLASMFRNAVSMNATIGHWDVSNERDEIPRQHYIISKVQGL